MSTNSQTSQQSPIAMTYARSLLELANERGQAAEIGQEMRDLAGILASNPQFKEFFSNPSISSAERARKIDAMFKGQVSDLLFNLISVANQKGRSGLLGEIAATFNVLLDEQLGNVDVNLTSAQALDDGQAQSIGQRVGQILGKNAILHRRVDDSIIGGLIVRVGDKVLDASVKTQLKSLRQRCCWQAIGRGEPCVRRADRASGG